MVKITQRTKNRLKEHPQLEKVTETVGITSLFGGRRCTLFSCNCHFAENTHWVGWIPNDELEAINGINAPSTRGD